MLFFLQEHVEDSGDTNDLAWVCL